MTSDPCPCCPSQEDGDRTEGVQPSKGDGAASLGRVYFPAAHKDPGLKTVGFSGSWWTHKVTGTDALRGKAGRGPGSSLTIP